MGVARKCAIVSSILVVVPLLLLGFMVLNAELNYQRPKDIEKCSSTHKPITGEDIVDRFAQALRIKTITSGPHTYDRDELVRFRNFLRASFPMIHAAKNVKVDVVGNYSLLFEITGSDLSLKPYLLCSHMDVVPVEREKWSVDPFAGVIKDGFIYGRGTIDVKNCVMAIMEALEHSIKTNYKFKRSFFIAFGHDEEALGTDGAKLLSEEIRTRGVKEVEFLLDEGLMMFEQAFPGVNELVALVGVAEKGYATIKMTATGEVGHSSIPNSESSVNTLAQAMTRFHSTTYPSKFGQGPEKTMIETFAKLSKYPFKLLYANLWFFKPILSKVMSQDSRANALIRTTTALTMLQGGYKENVVPGECEATINHRIHPSQSVQEVLEYDRELVKDLKNVKLEVLPSAIEPHPISPSDENSFGFQIVRKSIMQVFNITAVIPGIMVANTDTRWYLPLTKNVYRFSPSIMVTKEDSQRFHGHDERISVENYLQTVNFFHHVILNSDGPRPQVRMIRDEL